MNQKTLLPGCEAAVCVPRMTAAKEGEGWVMVLMSGKQAVVAAAGATVVARTLKLWPYLTRKRRCEQLSLPGLVRGEVGKQKHLAD